MNTLKLSVILILVFVAACSGDQTVAPPIIDVPERMSPCQETNKPAGASEIVFEAGINAAYREAFRIERRGAEVFGPSIQRFLHDCPQYETHIKCRTYKATGYTKGRTTLTIIVGGTETSYTTPQPMDFLWNGQTRYCAPR